MSVILPLGTEVEFIGEKAKSVSRSWYIKGGTFCSNCQLKYDFAETNYLYRRSIKMGCKGLRCPQCHQRLRTRSKAKPLGRYEGFWGRIRQVKELGK